MAESLNNLLARYDLKVAEYDVMKQYATQSGNIQLKVEEVIGKVDDIMAQLNDENCPAYFGHATDSLNNYLYHLGRHLIALETYMSYSQIYIIECITRIMEEDAELKNIVDSLAKFSVTES